MALNLVGSSVAMTSAIEVIAKVWIVATYRDPLR